MSVVKSEGLLTCKYCDKVYKKISYFKKHVQSHEDPVTNPSQSREELIVSKIQLYSCPHCSKQYKKESAFQKHLLLHDTENVPPVPPQDTQLNDIDWDENPWPEEVILGEDSGNIPSYFELEEEEEEMRRNMQLTGQSESPNIATNKKAAKAPLIRCITCPDTKFSTLEGYIKHLKSHAFKELCLNVPSLQRILQECKALSTESLQEIVKRKYAVYPGISVCEYAKAILSETAYDSAFSVFTERVCHGLCDFLINNQVFTFPSELRQTFITHSSAYMGNLTERAVLQQMLNMEILQSSTAVIDMFLGSFMRILSDKLLVFIVKYIIHGESVNLNNFENLKFRETEQRTDTLEFRQTIHYIAGANVRSVLRKGLRLKHPNEEWKRIIDVLKYNFLISDLANSPPSELMAWTEAQDRGKLFKVNNCALDFFVKLGALVKPLEHLDGSLYITEVMEKVASSRDMIIAWDEIIKQSLPKQESFKLLHALCSHFCITWLTGIISRRKDEEAFSKYAPKHGTSGVSFRASIV